MALAQLNYEIGADLSKLDLSINEINALIKKFTNEAKSASKDGLAPLNAEIAKLIQQRQKLQGIGLPESLPNTTKKSTIALNDLSRVVQDLPFGFIGIQNNIPALVQSFGGLTQAEGGLRAGLAGLGKSLIGPAGLLFAFSAVTSAITFAIQKYGSLGAAFDAIFKSSNQLSESQKKIIDNIAEESTQVFTLFGLYTNLNDNRNLQEQVLQKLNKVSPEYFGNLDKEINKLGELNIATDKYIKSLLGKIFVETQQAQVTEILKKYAAQLNKVVENEINLSKQRDKDKNKLKDQVELFDRLEKSQKKLSDIVVPVSPLVTKKTTTDVIKDLSDSLKKDITDLFGASSKFADVLNLDDIFGKKQEGTRKSTEKIDKTIEESNQRQEAAFKILQQAYIATLTEREQELFKIQDEYEQKRGDLLRANISDFSLIEEEKLIAIRKVVEKYDKIALDEFEKQKNAELKIAKEQAKQIEDLFKNDTLNFQPKINIDYSKLGFSQQILDQLNKGFTIGEAVKNIENQTLSVGKSIFNNIINPLNQVFDVILSKGEKSWENFTKSVVEQLKKLYARLAAAAAIAGILSLATGGTAGGGVSFIKAFGSILGVNLGGGNIANPSFGGVQPGGMQMAGSVNMVLRGQDLVGSLNRTNSQFSRIG